MFLIYISVLMAGMGFVDSLLVYRLSESAQEGFVVGDIKGRSGLSAKYNASIVQRLRYSLMSRGSLPTDFFRIHNRTSELRVAKAIDRDNLCDLLMICCDFEGKCKIPLSVLVQPITRNSFAEMIDVEVEIIDVNDNSPHFQSRAIRGHISEVADVGSSVTLSNEGNPLIANDRDSASYGVKRYSIISPTETFSLRVREEYNVITDVSIVSEKLLDREKTGTYTVVVMAHDGGQPPKSGSVTVEIAVDDFNDHTPKFGNESYSVTISETAPINSFIINVRATDADDGVNAAIVYSIKNLPSDIVSRLFTIDPSSGEIRTKGLLNFEQKSSYRIHVEATDRGLFIRRKARATVLVHLEDENDHGPIIKTGYLGEAERAEVRESAPIGTLVAFLKVVDPDDDKVSCIIDNPMFRLHHSTTNYKEFRLNTAHELNRELAENYRVTLTCSDDGKPQMKTTETVMVHILDANDNAPVFTKSMYTASISENNELDTFILQVKAFDLDTGENARILYHLSREGEINFSINSASGRVYAKRVFNREENDKLYFKVFAKDNGSKPLYAEASVVVTITDENDNAPTFQNLNQFEISEAAGVGVMLGHMSATDPDVGLNAEISFDLRRDTDSRSFAITDNGIITTLVQLDRETQSRYHLVVIARDRGVDITQSSSTTVTIRVTDINDNAPIIRFPNAYNNTIYISYLEPVGHTIVHVNASDRDTERNALLEYSFTHGNEARDFTLDKQSGAIRVAKPFRDELLLRKFDNIIYSAPQKQDALVYKLGIQVMDLAEPYNTNTELLNIVVDGSGKPINIDGAYLENIAHDKNLIIVICLAAVSVILAVILVIAIICIRRVDRERHLYNVQTEAQIVQEQHLSPSKWPTQGLMADQNQQEDNYSHVNGHQIPVYSSLRSQNWKSSVYPKPLAVGTKV